MVIEPTYGRGVSSVDTGTSVTDMPEPLRIFELVEPRAPDEPLGVAALLQFAREQLSPYMCPPHVVQVRELPLTANGKIRKHDLRERWQVRS